MTKEKSMIYETQLLEAFTKLRSTPLIQWLLVIQKPTIV
jgi:hypothetical protein